MKHSIALIILILLLSETIACNESKRVVFDYIICGQDGSVDADCYECVADEHCTDPTKPVCQKDIVTCVACPNNEECAEKNADAPICDMTTGACVECTTNSQCSTDGTEVCDLETNTCTSTCTENADCSDVSKSTCNIESGLCIPCSVETQDCTHLPNTPICDATLQQCVQCISSTDCLSSNNKVCDTSNHTCTSGCTSNEQCALADNSSCNPETQLCEPCTTNDHCMHLPETPACNNGLCVQCTPSSMDEVCDAQAPLCEPSLLMCVQCLDNQDCNQSNASLCDENNECAPCQIDADCSHLLDTGSLACDAVLGLCVECTQNIHCSGDTPVCDTVLQQCVACTDTDTSYCDENSLVCKIDVQQCVQCLSNSDCASDAQNSLCDTNVCAQCQVDDDCSLITGANVCASDGCVECTAENEDACAVSQRCKASSNTCVTQGSQDACDTCDEDIDCLKGQYCVPMTFGSSSPVSVGSFCLYQKPDEGCAVDNEDLRPYSRELTATSTDGVSGIFCAPSSLTSCPAINEFAVVCSSADECGDSSNALADGRCETLTDLSGTRCTYSCDSLLNNADCSGTRTCTGGYCK